jgi:hypothetical protein
MKTKFAFRFSLCLFVSMLSSQSFAGVIFLGSPASLALLNDFESTVNNASVSFDAQASLQPSGTWTEGVTPSGTQGLVESLGDAPLNGTFSSYYTSMGFWFGNDDFGLGFDAILEVFDGATSLGAVSLAANRNDFADQFIGLTSDTAFNKFQISYERPEASGLSVYIDDIYAGESAVPEPSILSLMVLALAGLGIRSRRKAV